MKYIFIALVLLGVVACGPGSPSQVELTEIQRESLLQQLAIYLDDRPENVSGEARFDKKHKKFYAELVKRNEASIEQLVAQCDTLYFMYKKKDRRSLYEHYRFIGGKLAMSDSANIAYLDILFHTPRLGPEELDKGQFLFDKMLAGESLASMHGDMKYIEWPDADYAYNPAARKWELKPESKLNELEYFREKKAD
jgi:hypothetical protein